MGRWPYLSEPQRSCGMSLKGVCLPVFGPACPPLQLLALHMHCDLSQVFLIFQSIDLHFYHTHLRPL